VPSQSSLLFSTYIDTNINRKNEMPEKSEISALSGIFHAKKIFFSKYKIIVAFVLMLCYYI
jgi:hypothetical protein